MRFPPQIGFQFQFRLLGLSLSPIAIVYWWYHGELTVLNILLSFVLPLFSSAVQDYVEAQLLQRQFDLALRFKGTKRKKKKKGDDDKDSDDNEPKLQGISNINDPDYDPSVYVDVLANSGKFKMEQSLPPATHTKYLVVGTGGVGRRIIEILRERGEEHVYGFDISTYTGNYLKDESYFIQADVTKIEDCHRVVDRLKPDVIYHTAAVITYSQSKQWQWPRSEKVNVQGVENMLKAAAQTNGDRIFILTSSSTAGISRTCCNTRIMGNETDFPPVIEPHNCLSWYSLSKAMAEVKGLEFCSTAQAKNLKFGIIRPSSGIFHARDLFLAQRSLSEMDVPATGFEYSIIDYVYVDNVVLGHLLLEYKLREGKCPNGETFIISNQEPMSGLEWSARIKKLVPEFQYWK